MYPHDKYIPINLVLKQKYSFYSQPFSLLLQGDSGGSSSAAIPWERKNHIS